MHFSTAISRLIEAGLDAEVETDGPSIFILAHDVNGRMHMLLIKAGRVRHSQVTALLDAAARRTA
jgi:hypothetical protein